MTLQRAAVRHVGRSDGTKPTDTPIGSTFEETDTGLVHLFDGTNWTAFKAVDRQAELLEEIKDILSRVDQRLEFHGLSL